MGGTVSSVCKDHLPVPNAECMARAVQVVSHRHGFAAEFAHPLERYHLRTLGHPTVLRKLVIWYGG